jgi:hypothetical protein
MFTRERGGERLPALKNLTSLTTAGALIARDTDLISWSYSSIISTLPRKNMQTAFCQDMTRIGSYEALKRSTGPILV